MVMRYSEEVLTRFTLKTAAGRKVLPGQPYIAGLYYQVEMALYDVDGMQLTDEVYTGVAGVVDGTQKTPDASKPTALALTARLTTGAGAGTESTIKSGAIPGYAPAVAVEDIDGLFMLAVAGDYEIDIVMTVGGATTTLTIPDTLTIAAAPVALAAPDCAGGCTAILPDAAGAVPVAGLPDPQCHLHVQAGVRNTMRVGLYDAEGNAQVPVSTVPHRLCNR
jgi:hypothetical protein